MTFKINNMIKKEKEHYVECSKEELEQLKIQFQSGWMPKSLEATSKRLHSYSIQYKDDEILFNGRTWAKVI